MERTGSYKSGVLGGHGEDFQRHLALLLLTRATLSKRPFKLGIEMREDAGKFDDVVLFDEDSEEWWLIQTKHTMQQNLKLGREGLLPNTTKGDFSLFKYFKSYLHVKQHWGHGGKRIRFFLFTNREFDGSMEVTDAEVDGMLRFSNAKHMHLKPDPEVVQAIQDYINSDYDLLCKAIVGLFTGEGVDQVLKKYKVPLSKVLIKNENCVKFSDSFNEKNPNWRIRNLYNSVKTALKPLNKDIKSLSLELPQEMRDFWKPKSRDQETVLPLVDRATVERFFDKFILSTSQPNARELVTAINDEWRYWMRSWIRPDALGKLDRDQLGIPFNSFRASFEQWEKRSQSREESEFLVLENGEQFLAVVESKLSGMVGF